MNNNIYEIIEKITLLIPNNITRGDSHIYSLTCPDYDYPAFFNSSWNIKDYRNYLELNNHKIYEIPPSQLWEGYFSHKFIKDVNRYDVWPWISTEFKEAEHKFYDHWFKNNVFKKNNTIPFIFVNSQRIYKGKIFITNPNKNISFNEIEYKINFIGIGELYGNYS